MILLTASALEYHMEASFNFNDYTFVYLEFSADEGLNWVFCDGQNPFDIAVAAIAAFMDPTSRWVLSLAAGCIIGLSLNRVSLPRCTMGLGMPDCKMGLWEPARTHHITIMLYQQSFPALKHDPSVSPTATPEAL
ncbi:hypothetical protein FRB94_011602 [Tulasnella sp. JGI-2019a]|nr:hypothetical protein FRB93_010118 [Tulasnella sp. JGI-2019a]KAG8992478.1 hypothetical protein FRB94_011602 [Tulasnella sp. JGI-2019a]